MAYTKTSWSNDTAPAINASNLNKIENELEYLDNLVNNVEILTPEITPSVGTLVVAGVKKLGNIVMLTVAAKNTSNVAVGSNVFRGVIESDYIPKSVSYGVGYYGSTLGALEVSTAGQVTIRCIGAQLAANNTIYATVMYMI